MAAKKKPAKRKNMTYAQIAKVLQKALTDAKFRQRLLSSPAAALKAEGHNPDQADIKFFMSLGSENFASAADRINKSRDGVEAGEV